MVVHYFGSVNFAGTISQLGLHFPHNIGPPDRSTVMRNVNKYLTCGGSLNRKRGHRGRLGEHWLRSPDPASRFLPCALTCLIGQLAHRYSIGSQYWILLWTLKSCSIKMLAKWWSFKKKRIGYGHSWSTGRDRFLCNQTKEIQRDFTKFTVIFEAKVQITQNKNLVKAIVNIHYIIVNSNHNFLPVSQKKIVKMDVLLLTHAVYQKHTGYYTDDK